MVLTYNQNLLLTVEGKILNDNYDMAKKKCCDIPVVEKKTTTTNKQRNGTFEQIVGFLKAQASAIFAVWAGTQLVSCGTNFNQS